MFSVIEPGLIHAYVYPWNLCRHQFCASIHRVAAEGCAALLASRAPCKGICSSAAECSSWPASSGGLVAVKGSLADIQICVECILFEDVSPRGQQLLGRLYKDCLRLFKMSHPVV